VTRLDSIGKQFDSFRRQDMDIFGIRVVPTAAYGRIAKKRHVMASMRRIDCGCKTRLFRKPGDCEASNSRNDVVKELIGVAGRLRAFEHHIGSFRFKA
jgi:hypothetical protein